MSKTDLKAFLWVWICTLLTFWSHNNHLFSSLYLRVPGKGTCVHKRREINLHPQGVPLYNAQDNTTPEQTVVLSLTCALKSDRTGRLSLPPFLNSPQDQILGLQTPFQLLLKTGPSLRPSLPPSPQKAMGIVTKQAAGKAPGPTEKGTGYSGPLPVQQLMQDHFPTHMRGIWYLAPSQKVTGIIWLNPQEILWRCFPRLIFYISEKKKKKRLKKFLSLKKKTTFIITFCTFIASFIWGYQSTLGYRC